MKWRGGLINDDGQIISAEESQDRIRRTIERTGRFVLACEWQPQIGEVAYFGGLPFRVVRYVSREEAQVDNDLAHDIWDTPGSVEPNHFYFEVEVAD